MVTKKMYGDRGGLNEISEGLCAYIALLAPLPLYAYGMCPYSTQLTSNNNWFINCELEFFLSITSDIHPVSIWWSNYRYVFVGKCEWNCGTTPVDKPTTNWVQLVQVRNLEALHKMVGTRY